MTTTAASPPTLARLGPGAALGLGVVAALLGLAIVLVTRLRWSEETLWALSGTVVTLALLLRAVRRIRRVPQELFHPAVMYPLAFATYFTIGTLNLTKRGGVLDPSILGYFGLGLLSYLTAGPVAWLVTARRPTPRWSPALPDPAPPSRALTWLSIALVVCGLLALALAWTGVGRIPLFDERVRVELNSYLTAVSQASWIGLFFLGAQVRDMGGPARLAFAALFVVTIAMLALGGYRTPLVLATLTTLVALTLTRRRISFRVLAMVMVVLFLSGSVLQLARTSFVYGYARTKLQYIEQGLPPELLLLGPIHAVAREGPLVFTALRGALGGRTLNGDLFLSDWASILPGKQNSSRMIITDLVVNRTEASKTPSVVGALYVDFGPLGIAVGMFLIGTYLNVLYRLWMMNRSTATLTLYAYTAAYTLIAIHTGGIAEPVYVLSTILLIGTPLAAKVLEPKPRGAGRRP